MCAITDHDYFSFDMYKALKKYEGKEISKVLPGVEFSVRFDGKRTIHIVTIFDDRNEDKLNRLNQLFVDGIGKVNIVSHIVISKNHQEWLLHISR